MSERKRRRAEDAARQLEQCAGELRELGAALGAREFRAASAAVSVPLRASRAPPAPRRAAARSPGRSLFSLESGAAYAARASAAGGADAWAASLQRLGEALDAQDPRAEAGARAERLWRRHAALGEAARLLQDKLRRAGDEVALQDRVESQLAREEAAWERQMQAREQRVAEREVELQALRDEAAADAPRARADEAADAEPDDDVRAELQEALALRAEERRDIQAAVDSLQRKRARRRAELRASPPSPAAQQADAAAAARRQVLRELRDEKEALQRAIIAAEEREEQQAENAADLPALKAALAEAKQRRAREQANVDALRLELARRKRKMRHMVDVQLLTARDTNPPTLREEAVLLHLLYEREGEMGVNELKQEASAVLQAHGKPSGNGVVIRALYSLVANGVVQIDRSFGNGLVTSLLV